MSLMPDRKLVIIAALILIATNFMAFIPYTRGDGESNPFVSSPGKIKSYWSITWGGSGDDVITDMDVVDGNIYVCGSTTSYGNKKAFLLKYDDNGNLIWNTTWSGKGEAEANALMVSGNYIYVAGTTEKSSNKDVFISKYNLDGKKEWFKTWGGGGDDEGKDIYVYDNEIYVCGFTRSYGVLGSDILLLKFDMNGDLLSNKFWGKAGDEVGNGVVVTSEGVYVDGYTESYGVGGKDAIILGFGDTGNVKWLRTWGGEDDDELVGMEYASPYLYMVGNTASYTPHALFLKYDEDGNMIFERRWGEKENDEAMDSAVYNDVTYIVGISRSYGKNGDVLLLKYDSDGMLSWSKIWGGSGEDAATSVDVDNKRIYIAGYTESYGNGGKDALIIKTGLEGRKSLIVSGTFLTIEGKWIVVEGRKIFPLFNSFNNGKSLDVYRNGLL